jgi:signal transduction histidine kinase
MPAQYQPPLTVWSHAWRYALCLAISAVVWMEVVEGQWEQYRAWFWADIGLGVFSYCFVLLRRRMPMTVAVVLTVLAAFSGIAAGPATLASVSLAARRVPWQVVVLGLVSLNAGQAFTTLQPTAHNDPYWIDLTVNFVATVAILGWGMYIGSRRELLWRLRDEVTRAREEQELKAREARGSERARIAREMHDVLAHRISQVSMHANALAFREDLTAEQMRDSVGIIQQKANEALTDLRTVLGVLRDPDTGAPLARPQPTYGDLGDLVGEARASGMHVEYDDRAAPGMPTVAGRTVYRIVQEGLTNARKHAPGALVTVIVSGSESDGVDVEVRNPVGFAPVNGTTPPSGLGLVGLRERAELRGGRLEHGREGTAFVLHGWIPWAE